MKNFVFSGACTSCEHCGTCLVDVDWRKRFAAPEPEVIDGKPRCKPWGVTLENHAAKLAAARRSTVHAPRSKTSRFLPGTALHAPRSKTSRFLPGTALHHILVPIVKWIQRDASLLRIATALAAIVALVFCRTPFPALALLGLNFAIIWLATFNLATCRCASRAAKIDRAWLRFSGWFVGSGLF